MIDIWTQEVETPWHGGTFTVYAKHLDLYVDGSRIVSIAMDDDGTTRGVATYVNLLECILIKRTDATPEVVDACVGAVNRFEQMFDKDKTKRDALDALAAQLRLLLSQ